MIKYTCVNKQSMRVHTFLSIFDETTETYRLAHLDTGNLLATHFNNEEIIDKYLSVLYEIKIKK